MEKNRITKNFLWLTLPFFIFLFFFQAWGVKISQDPQTKKSIEQVGKDVQELQQLINNLQKKLEKIDPSLLPVPLKAEDQNKENLKKIETTSLVALQYFEQIKLHLKERIKEFLDGLKSLKEIPKVFYSHKNIFKHYLLGFILSIGIGVFFVFGSGYFLKHWILETLLSLKERNIASATIIAILSCITAMPLIGYFLLSFILSIIFQSFSLFVQGASLAGNFYVLFPTNLYIIWASFLWTDCVFSPKNPKNALIPLTYQGAKQVVFWIHLAFLSYFFGEIFLEIANLIQLDNAGIRAFSDILGLFISYSLLKGISIIKNYLKISPTELTSAPQIFRTLYFLKYVVIGFFFLWIIARNWFSKFLFPTLITGIVVAIAPSLQKLFRQWRLSYLWKNRHISFFLKPFLMSHAWMNKLSTYSVYLFLGSIWSIYLWNFESDYGISILWQWIPIFFASSFFTHLSNSLIIIGISYLILQAGDKILKYYVEEKYAKENHFLVGRLKTLLSVAKTFLRILVLVPAIFMIITEFGREGVTSLCTWLGGFSLGLGFGIRGIVSDFTSGFFIIFENNLMIGDDVEIDGKRGRVEEIHLRTLKIRADNGALITVPYGSIVIIANRNREFCAVVLNISVAYNENLEKVQDCIESAFQKLKKLPVIGRKAFSPIEIRGINEVTSFSVVFQARIRTMPNSQEMVHRAFNRLLKEIFDEQGILVPSNLHAVHFAEPSLTNTRI